MTLKQITDALLSLNRLKKILESVWKIQYLKQRVCLSCKVSQLLLMCQLTACDNI